MEPQSKSTAVTQAGLTGVERGTGGLQVHAAASRGQSAPLLLRAKERNLYLEFVCCSSCAFKSNTLLIQMNVASKRCIGDSHRSCTKPINTKILTLCLRLTIGMQSRFVKARKKN